VVFGSSVFLFVFLPLVFIPVLAVRNVKINNVILLAASLAFYAWGEPVYIVLLLVSVLVNYLLALSADGNSDRKTKRIMTVLTVVFNIGLITVFKYSSMIVSTVNALLLTDIPLPDISMPVGISFYTFQAMSYVLDVYSGKSKAQRNIFKLMLYISLFPQLIAGPIVKYRDIEQQIDNRSVTVDKTAAGIRRFIVGLSKKMLIANCMGKAADSVFALETEALNMPVAWIGILCYSLQIYFDFSGYSDMAIGLGKMAGFDFAENFNYPYISCSVKEFWRRWHISLSLWFREYVYIPLGGNREGRAREGLNKLVVFFLTGLWHGAQWTFVAWGLMHGVFIMLESYRIINPEKWRIKPLSHLYTLIVVVSAFVLFRADSFGYAFGYLRAMFLEFDQSQQAIACIAGLLTGRNILVFFAAIAASLPIVPYVRKRTEGLAKVQKVASVTGYVFSCVLFGLCLLELSSSTYNPFIYFRF